MNSATDSKTFQRILVRNVFLPLALAAQVGQAQVTYEMRGQLSPEKLGTQVLNFLAQYLNATIGTQRPL